MVRLKTGEAGAAWDLSAPLGRTRGQGEIVRRVNSVREDRGGLRGWGVEDLSPDLTCPRPLVLVVPGLGQHLQGEIRLKMLENTDQRNVTQIINKVGRDRIAAF